ncbi:MAG: MotA/TolQ/ExbB proton channel family protein [Pseudomonadota bacterium]|jgi:biopolymer transport protein ExbB
MVTDSSTLIINATLWVLIAFSVLTWTLIVLKVWQYWRQSLANRSFEDRFWGASTLDEARGEITAGKTAPVVRLAGAGFAVLDSAGQSHPPALKYRGDLLATLERKLKRQLERESRLSDIGLTVLASIGSTAPFVGLFGTVWGIMRALQDISKSGKASLEVVAGPIGEALIATAIGIAVAVPAVLAYNFLMRQSRRRQQALEIFAEDFLHLVSAETAGRSFGYAQGE